MDMRDQYMEFLSSLRDVGGSDQSLLFSWSRSMGGNALGLYAYYMGGILSFLTCLFPISSLHIAIEVLILIKLGLCGLSMAVFLEFGISREKGRPAIVIFSACYALMSYNMAYSACYFWLTGCVFLPIVMLGIEQLLKKKKGFRLLML